MSSTKQFIAYGLAVVFLPGCGLFGKKSDDSGGGTVKASFQASRISETALNLASESIGMAQGNLGLTSSTMMMGQSVGSQLESLSYRLSGISLCGKLTTEGTASSCSGGGEWSLYDGGRSGSGDYDNYLPADAAADTTNFTNFMDSDSLSKLSQNLTYSDGNVQSYDSVLVYWYRPFKVKASVSIIGTDTVLHTKASTEFTSNGASGLDVSYETKVSGMTSGSAEEGVFFLPNGGTYFKLQKKFEITQADVDNKTSFKVVMAFDPDGFIKGESYNGEESTGSLSGMADPTAKYRIQAPFLQIAPVIARESETIMRETYLLRSKEGATNPHDLRLSLYYVKEDADKSVRAVTSTILYNNSSVLRGDDFAQIDSIGVVDADTIDLKDWLGQKVIGGLKRTTVAGEVGSVTHEVCAGEITSTGCSGGTTTTSYSYALVSVDEAKASITASYIPPTPTPTTNK